MSRRNQGRRRRAYAKRQHEVRQRRTDQPGPSPDWTDSLSGQLDEMAEARGLDDLHAQLIERRHGGRAAA
jgi:hypothetical protein